MSESTPVARSRRRVVEGVVEAASTAKTIKVGVVREFKHRKYEKRLRRKSVLAVHDEKSEARIGDVVEIMASRKLSKTKSWRLVKVVKRDA